MKPDNFVKLTNGYYLPIWITLTINLITTQRLNIDFVLKFLISQKKLEILITSEVLHKMKLEEIYEQLILLLKKKIS